MSRAVRRHSGNYAAVVLLVFVTALGLDWLLIQVGWPPIAGCMVRPVLHLLLGLTVGTWMITAGVLLCLFAGTRPTGLALIAFGLLIGVLPQLLEAYLSPLCRMP